MQKRTHMKVALPQTIGSSSSSCIERHSVPWKAQLPKPTTTSAKKAEAKRLSVCA